MHSLHPFPLPSRPSAKSQPKVDSMRQPQLTTRQLGRARPSKTYLEGKGMREKRLTTNLAKLGLKGSFTRCGVSPGQQRSATSP